MVLLLPSQPCLVGGQLPMDIFGEDPERQQRRARATGGSLKFTVCRLEKCQVCI